MQTPTHEIADKVRTLPDTEKLVLVDQLLAQLDKPDPEIDRIWADEARKRWREFQEGRMEAVPYAAVMSKYKRP